MAMKPMLAKDGDLDQIPSGPDWVMEPKWDGCRVLLERSADGSVSLATRGGNRIVSVPYVSEALARQVPCDSIVDGELISPLSFRHVQSIVKRQRAHRPGRGDPAVSVVAFDVLRVAGEDVHGLALQERRRLLTAAFEPNVEAFEIPEWQPPSLTEYERLLDGGFEGAMVKHVRSPYYPGRRSGAWLKLKAVETIDCRCVGFFRGNGSFDDPEWWRTHGSDVITAAIVGDGPRSVGGMIYQTPAGRQERMSGMKDDERQLMAAKPGDYIGRTVEVRYSRGDGDALRHARYGQMRDAGAGAAPPPSKLPATKSKRAGAGLPKPPTRRRRNYAAMNDKKLEAVIAELAGKGEAYNRCLESGSGDPAMDLELALALARDRGLEVDVDATAR